MMERSAPRVAIVLVSGWTASASREELATLRATFVMKPFRANEFHAAVVEFIDGRDEAARGKIRDRNCHGDGKERGEAEPCSAESVVARQQRESEAGGEVVQSDQRKRAEAPEDESVRGSGDGPLLNHLALQQDFEGESANARGEQTETEAGIGLSGRDDSDDPAKTKPEAAERRADEKNKDNLFRQGGEGHEI